MRRSPSMLAIASLVAIATASLSAGPAAAAPHHAKLAAAHRVGGFDRCLSRRLKRSPREARAATRRPRRCSALASPSGDPQPLYWGATIGSQLTGVQAPWDMSAVSKFEELTRKPLSLIQLFQPFADCGS